MSEKPIALNETLESLVSAQTNIKSSLLSHTFKRPMLLDKTITSDGVYIPSNGYDGYHTITVHVGNYEEKYITSDGIYTPSSGYAGISQVVVDIIHNYEEKYITSDGIYIPSSGYAGISQVVVDEDVADSYIDGTLTSVTLNWDTIPMFTFYQRYTITTASFPNCTYIGRYAFCSCSLLTSVSFPQCTNIDYGAFNNCTSLSIASFPMCTSIDDRAFSDCTSLSIASFPMCTSIGVVAFAYCSSLSIASFPNCSYIGYGAFECCYNLISLYLDSVSSVTKLTNSDAFTSTPIGGYSTSAGRYGSIYVPSSLLESFKTATNWVYFSSRMVGV